MDSSQLQVLSVDCLLLECTHHGRVQPTESKLGQTLQLTYGHSLRVKGALYSWQYLFILEGCVPIILGLIAPFWLAKDCKTAWYLSGSERELASRRMQTEDVAHGEEENRLSRRDFIDAFTDWRIWTTMLGNLLTSLASQGLSVFMPIIIKVG